MNNYSVNAIKSQRPQRPQPCATVSWPILVENIKRQINKLFTLSQTSGLKSICYRDIAKNRKKLDIFMHVRPEVVLVKQITKTYVQVKRFNLSKSSSLLIYLLSRYRQKQGKMICSHMPDRKLTDFGRKYQKAYLQVKCFNLSATSSL